MDIDELQKQKKTLEGVEKQFKRERKTEKRTKKD